MLWIPFKCGHAFWVSSYRCDTEYNWALVQISIILVYKTVVIFLTNRLKHVLGAQMNDLIGFVWLDSLHPINNLSAIKGQIFLGWTSTKLGSMFLLKDTMQWCRWGLNPRPFGLQSSTLPLSHCAPPSHWDSSFVNEQPQHIQIMYVLVEK